MRWQMVAGLGVALVALTAVAEEARMAQLREAHERELEALRQRDPALLAEAFTEDAVALPADGEALVGRDAIVAHYAARADAAESEPGTGPETRILDVVVSGPWALERFRYRVRGEAEGDEKAAVAYGGGVHLYRRGADGTWRTAFVVREPEPAAPASEEPRQRNGDRED